MIEHIDLELAIEKVYESVNEIADVEEILLEDSLNRIAGDDVYATMNQPPFDRSPLDGYAVRAIDTKGASKETPIKLKVVDEIFAGAYTDKKIKEKEAIRIMTGSKMPKGSDCVIKQELTDYGIDYVNIYQEFNKFDNYCFAGSDIKKGTKIISKGQKITHIHIAVIASMGFEKIKVRRKPKVAIMCTGDEIITTGSELAEGKIYDSNRRMVHSRIKALGCDIAYVESLGDDPNEVSDEIRKIIDDVDLIISTGGVSVGKKDIMHEVVKILDADKVFWKMSFRPGAPVIYSVYKNKPLLSLSGNPFAALTMFDLLVKPILYKLTNDDDFKFVTGESVIEDDFKKNCRTRRLIRAIYKYGRVYLPDDINSAGGLMSMVDCNCFIDIAAGTEKLSKGDTVKVIFL